VRQRLWLVLGISGLLLSACSQVQEVIDTGNQVIDTAQGLGNVCQIAEPIWTQDLSPKQATGVLKSAVTELETLLKNNSNLVPDVDTLLQDLKFAVKQLEEGLTKKELKEITSSIKSICAGLGNS
jgi:hypothetical protein